MRAHGIEGAVRLSPFSDDPRNIRPGASVFIDGEELHPAAIREVENGLIVVLDGIASREAAAALSGRLVEMRRDDLEPLGDGTFYVADLVGLRAVTEAGETIGTITDVLPTGANDVYVIDLPDGSELLVPAIADVVLQVVIEEGLMVVRPQESSGN